MAATHKTRRDHEREAAQHLARYANSILASFTVEDNVLTTSFRHNGRKYRVTVRVETQDEE